jgi:hypothetical protein
LKSGRTSTPRLPQAWLLSIEGQQGRKMRHIPRSIARSVKRLIGGAPAIATEPEIPPPDINFNPGGGDTYAEYARLFKEKACLVDVPLLIEKAGLRPSSVILDYGCGMGRLTYALGKFLSPDGVYYGYEINPVGLNFIRSAYRNRPNFHFDGQLLHLDEDYVAKLRGQRRPETIGATEVDLTRLVSQPLDIQWSASVFTHMWPDAITHVLKQVRRLSARKPVLSPSSRISRIGSRFVM